MKHYFIIMLALICSACSHEDPLQVASPRYAGQFLFEASYAAEKNLKNKHYGTSYGQCIKGEETNASYCEQLYYQMIQFAQQYHDTLFHTLTISDITNRRNFHALEDAYNVAVMNRIDE